MLCENPQQPICREFVNQGKCRSGNKCRFYHPAIIDVATKKRANKNPGYCYCGAVQTCRVNRRSYKSPDDYPTFFVVCARTNKSIKRCLRNIISGVINEQQTH